MRVDQYKTLVMEHVGYPGNIGDSCAETSRRVHQKRWLLDNPEPLDITQFITEKGFVRHPTAPEKDDKGESWREDDFTSDQGLPLFLAALCTLPLTAQTVKRTIIDAGWRTGNGDLIHPIFYAILKDNKFLINLFTVAQALLFRFVWRWNDEKNKFEETEESSCDYINYIHYALYASEWARNRVSKERLKEKVAHYYKVEPNCKWLVDDYNRLIDMYWR